MICFFFISIVVGKRINIGIVPPPSMYYANNDGYSFEMLAEDMFQKGMTNRLDSEGGIPFDLHYYNYFNNNALYQNISHMTD